MLSCPVFRRYLEAGMAENPCWCKDRVGLVVRGKGLDQTKALEAESSRGVSASKVRVVVVRATK